MTRERKPKSPEIPAALVAARANPWLGAGLVLIAFALFAGTLEDEYVLDGVSLVQKNPLLSPLEPLRIAGMDWWEGTGKPGGLYRPVSLVLLAVLRELGGGGPSFINLANVALHGVVAWLHFALLVRFLGPLRAAQPIAWLAALFALVHPLNVETIAGQVGIADLLAAAWMCAAVLVAEGASRTRFALGALFAMLAALSKESGVLVVPLAILFESLRRHTDPELKPRVVRALAWSSLGVALAVACRYFAIGSLASVDDPVYAGFSNLARMASACATFAGYSIPLLFVPWRQLAVVSHQDALPATGFGDPLALGGALIVLLLLIAPWFALRRGRRELAFGAWFFLAAWLPTSNLLFSSGAIAASRFLQLGLFALALPLAVFIVESWSRSAPLRVVAGLLAGWFIVGLSIVAWRETAGWRSDRELMEAQARRAPLSAYGLVDLGLALSDEDAPRALKLLATAAQSSVPYLPGHDVPPEDLLESLFMARLGIARILEPLGGIEGARAQENFRAAEMLAERGRKARETLPFREDWNSHRLFALQHLVSATLQRAKLLAGAEQTLALDEAARDLDACDACEPASSESIRLRSILLELRGDSAGRARLVEEAWKARPDDSLLRILWAHELRQRGRAYEALAIELDVAMALFDSFDHTRSLAIAKEGFASTDSGLVTSSRALLERLARSNSGRSEWSEASLEAGKFLYGVR